MEDLEIAARNILRDPVKHSARVPLSSHREKFSAKTVLKTAENLSSVAFSLWIVTAKEKALNVPEHSDYIHDKEPF